MAKVAKYDVSVVSHAGHSPGHYKVENSLDSYRTAHVPLEALASESEGDSGVATDWYTLQDQIAHKLAFLEHELHSRSSIILVGHSIGCWMILNLLPHLDSAKVKKVFMLFPTIEKMSLTPNAQSFTSYLWTSLRKPFTGLVWMASRLVPHGIKQVILYRYFHTTPSEHLDHIVQGVVGIDERSMYNILKMANQEMDEVVEPPLQVINDNVDKIVFYYGVGDRWNVDSCYTDMADRYPNNEVHLCKRGIHHAFVECSSNEMADFVHSKLILNSDSS